MFRNLSIGSYLIRVLAIALLGGAGCKIEQKRFDPQPDRALLEDRWNGYTFDRVTAQYALSLQKPAPGLNRRSGQIIPILSNQPDAPSNLSSLNVVRPTHALVSLDFVAGVPSKSKVTVTVRWPKESIPPPTKSWTEETFESNVRFEDVCELLNESEQFRCDEEDPYYRPLRLSEMPTRFGSGEMVELRISGPNPKSHYERRVEYHSGAVLWRIAQLACPDLG